MKTKLESSISCNQNSISHVNSNSAVALHQETSFINPLHNHENHFNFSPKNVHRKYGNGNSCNGKINSKHFDSKQNDALAISKIYNCNHNNEKTMSHSPSESRNETANGIERTTILPAF